jgi:hypothetical protein
MTEKTGRGEYLKSPTPEILIKEYLSEQAKITSTPHEKATPEAFKPKKHHLSNRMEHLKAENIDKK